MSHPWREPVNLGPTVNTSAEDIAPCISPNGLRLYFETLQPGGYAHYGISVSVRETIQDDWGAPVNLGPPVSTSNLDSNPIISADELFVDYSAHDLMLRADATARDFAQAIAAPHYDLLRRSRGAGNGRYDSGAFEFDNGSLNAVEPAAWLAYE